MNSTGYMSKNPAYDAGNSTEGIWLEQLQQHQRYSGPISDDAAAAAAAEEFGWKLPERARRSAHWEAKSSEGFI